MTSIQIGKLIYATLNSDASLAETLDSKIYPIVAPANTTFPFIVYTRVNAYVENLTKDGWLNDNVSFQITVVSDNYIQSVEMADAVRELFENCRISSEKLTMENIRMTSCSEAFNEDEYIQNLNFTCEAN